MIAVGERISPHEFRVGEGHDTIEVLWRPKDQAREPRAGDVLLVRKCCEEEFAIPPSP